MRPSAVVIALVLLMALPVQAGRTGTGIIHGAVHDNTIPVKDALVTVVGETTYITKSAKTSSRGIYIITDLPADEYLVRALVKNGPYHVSHRNILLKKGKIREVNFPMKRRKM